MPNREEMRGAVLAYLAEIAKTNTQVGQCNAVHEQFAKIFRRQPSTEEHRVLLELLYEQLLAGVLVFGKGLQGGTADGYPWITITEFGKLVLKEQKFLPYDPDGFLARIQKDLPELDATCLRYLREAVDGYSRNLRLSASVMLGVASESLMLQLVDAFAGWTEIDKAKFNEAIRGRTISEVYKELQKRLNSKLELLPVELRREIHVYLDGLFSLIRVIRNDAGHPTDTDVPKNVLYANIQAFPEYARRLLALRKFFLGNPSR